MTLYIAFLKKNIKLLEKTKSASAHVYKVVDTTKVTKASLYYTPLSVSSPNIKSW